MFLRIVSPKRSIKMLYRSVLGAAIFGLLQATPSCANDESQVRKTLFTTNYEGLVTSLSLTGTKSDLSLKPIATNKDCGPNASWLTLDLQRSVLFCLDESWAADNGSVTSFHVAGKGVLTKLDSVATLDSAIASTLIGENNHGLAVSFFDAGGFGTIDVSDPSNLKKVQTQQWPLGREPDLPWPASLQDKTRIHQVVLDPSGQYVVAPDLGGDLIRVFHLNQKTLQWTAQEPLSVAFRSGPRHATFITTRRSTYMYVVNELSSTITVHEVTYNDNNTLGFKLVQTIGTHGENTVVPKGTTAGEIAVSHDQKFLIVSSRLENSLKIDSFDPAVKEQIVSDPIINFSINRDNGKISLLQVVPAGGRVPRHFVINKRGNQVAVALQADGRVVLIDRDIKTGLLGKFVASVEGLGTVSHVIYKE